MSILLHLSTRSGSFCWGHELFCSSVEASFLGLVMRPSVDQQLIHVFTGSGVGLFLCSSKYVGRGCFAAPEVGWHKCAGLVIYACYTDISMTLYV